MNIENSNYVSSIYASSIIESKGSVATITSSRKVIVSFAEDINLLTTVVCKIVSIVTLDALILLVISKTV